MSVVFDCGGRWGLHRSWQHFQLPLTYASSEPDAEEAEEFNRSAEAHLRDKVEFIVVKYTLNETEGRAKLNLYDMRDLSSLFELSK